MLRRNIDSSSPPTISSKTQVQSKIDSSSPHTISSGVHHKIISLENYTDGLKMAGKCKNTKFVPKGTSFNGIIDQDKNEHGNCFLKD